MPVSEMKKILWIEDDALYDLAELATPVYETFRYKLEIAKNVSEGLSKIMTPGIRYDAIIVDIRLPPGNDPRWISLVAQNHNLATNTRLTKELGTQLLYSLLGDNTENALVKLPNIPNWIDPQIFGVFTVEENQAMHPFLQTLRIKHYRQKTSTIIPTALLELIEKVLENQSNSLG